VTAVLGHLLFSKRHVTAKATSHCNKATVSKDVFCAVRPKVISGEPMGDEGAQVEQSVVSSLRKEVLCPS
jgi:hypothetical protein